MPEHERASARKGWTTWLLALVPLILLGGLLAWIVNSDIDATLRGDAPPIEEIVVQGVVLEPGMIDVSVINDGPDPVIIAQVLVDEAYWRFDQHPEGALDHLDRATITIPYPWVEGEAHEITLLTATGATFGHEIEVALETPKPRARFFGLFALIGTYVGVLPVALGLLWLPLVRRLKSTGLDFVLALTLGLLLFLLVDTFHDGLEAAGELAASYQGVVAFSLVAVLAFLAIEALGGWITRAGGGMNEAWTSALLVAVAIGLHNFGEGLAIGAAFRLGEVALGTLLIVGFALHNVTEGLAIVAPLASERVRWARLMWFGLIAGAPTILGAWLGGFVQSTLWSVLFLGIGTGAIAQVILQIGRGMARERPWLALATSRPVLSGLAAGAAIMYFTGMIVGG